MKKQFFWTAALMVPLVVNSQCRVTELGGVSDITPNWPVALDKNGNSMTVFQGGPTIWGSNGAVKASADIQLPEGPYALSMNNVGQAVVRVGNCSSARPTYSSDLGIWKWTDGSVQCLKPLPFEVHPDFLQQGSDAATVIDDKGWVYANVTDTLNVNRAMAWPPNGAPIELPAPSFSVYRKALGGSASGLVVGVVSNHPDLSLGGAPVMWKNRTPSYLSIPLDMRQGEVQSAASNGDMVGRVAGPTASFSGIWWKSGGQQYELMPNFRPSFVNRYGRSAGWATTVPFLTPAIYANGAMTEIQKIVPSRWAKAGNTVVDVKGLNDKSQILVTYQRNSPEGSAWGAALLSGCFGAKS
ncbi:hypothetical protein [Ideonella paludis]|uniref:Uncharacterized protein n=1 Tax=Ideonella paludis TaxID=1233411 RepID=A0ABS5DYV5_9BURK|nr:hypothetical protein [Ideonella paludis]MBQ0936324.1 hypothetical protein [Ideonella paludis]